MSNRKFTFESQLEKTELNVPNNWKGDPRGKFQELLKPLLDGSEYYLAINTNDTSSRLLDLFHKGEKRRVMWFTGRQNMQINAAFNRDFYEYINQFVSLPENERPTKTQPHVHMSLKLLWNIICVATEQREYISQ